MQVTVGHLTTCFSWFHVAVAFVVLTAGCNASLSIYPLCDSESGIDEPRIIGEWRGEMGNRDAIPFHARVVASDAKAYRLTLTRERRTSGHPGSNLLWSAQMPTGTYTADPMSGRLGSMGVASDSGIVGPVRLDAAAGTDIQTRSMVCGTVVCRHGLRRLSADEPRNLRRSQATRKRLERRASALLKTGMTCPQDIPVPSYIPMHMEDGSRIVFPKHGYEEMYFQGWNECLYVIGKIELDPRGDIRSSCLTSFNNNWVSGAGLVAGFDDCQRQIVFLATIFNLDLIRETAKKLHHEIPGGVVWERKKRDNQQ